jgi:hypothetical protein
MAQKIAEYQETPKGDQQCSNCNPFEEPTRWSMGKGSRLELAKCLPFGGLSLL